MRRVIAPFLALTLAATACGGGEVNSVEGQDAPLSTSDEIEVHDEFTFNPDTDNHQKIEEQCDPENPGTVIGVAPHPSFPITVGVIDIDDNTGEAEIAHGMTFQEVGSNVFDIAFSFDLSLRYEADPSYSLRAPLGIDNDTEMLVTGIVASSESATTGNLITNFYIRCEFVEPEVTVNPRATIEV